MWVRMIAMLAVSALVFGGVFGFQVFKGVMIQRFFASRTEPPQTVAALAVSRTDWRQTIEVVGGLRAEFGTDIAPEVGGLVTAVPFRSGEDVAKGAILLRLKSDDDVARLAALKASADLARLTATRQRKLLSSGTIAQAALDSAEATLRNAEAQIIEQQALIDKKTIHAPFAGRIGLRLVDVGQVITAGTKAASLQALDRLYFDFTLPQQQLKAIKIGSDVEISTDAFPGDRRMGRVVAIDSKVDADTRNVAVRVEIANPQGNWLPGMYAKGVIAIGEPQPLITAPQTAISFNTYGDVVFVVEKEADSTDAAPHLTVRQKFVTTGERRGDQVSILGGIEDGTMIVTAGGMKLHNGSPVIISDKVPMPNDPHPNVRDQ